MRIGLNSTGTNAGTIDRLVDEARLAESAGLSSFWVPNYFGMDALTCLTIVGREVPRLALGTSVVPIYTRHPFAMAQQALTVQAAVGGRLTLGLGLSHRQIVEGSWGLSFERPAATMAAYLEALTALVRPTASGPRAGVPVDGQPIPPLVPGSPGLPVVVAALGPTMVDVAGRLADGVVLWSVGPAGITALVPRLAASAEAAGRPAPQVVASLPVCVTDDPAAARQRINARLAGVDELPSYRRALDVEGVRGIADVALVGSAADVLDALGRLEAAGVTEFAGMVVTSDVRERGATIEVLADAAARLTDQRPELTATTSTTASGLRQAEPALGDDVAHDLRAAARDRECP